MSLKAQRAWFVVPDTDKAEPTWTGVVQFNAPTISKKLSLLSPTAAITFNQLYDQAIESGDTTALGDTVTQLLGDPATAPLSRRAVIPCRENHRELRKAI